MFQPRQGQGQKEAEDEYDAIYSKFRKNPVRDSKFKDATDFHESHRKKASNSKVIVDTSAPIATGAVPLIDDFDKRLDSFKVEMDKHIPLIDIPRKTLPLGNGSDRNKVNTWDMEEKDTDDTESNFLDTRPAAEKGSRSISEKKSPQILITDSNPDVVSTDHRTGHGSVKSSQTISFHSGAQIRVNRVPSELIPPSSGSSVMGLYLHSSAWTKSPQWAQSIIAFAFGAVIGGMGYGLYKCVQKAMYGKVLASNKTSTRSHPREWNPELNSTPAVEANCNDRSEILSISSILHMSRDFV